jgi:hypothetical protein
MIVSHKYRFIFLKTRKTAGTSVEIALSRYCGPEDIITPLDPEDEETRRRTGGRGPQNYYIPIRRMNRGELAKLLKKGKRKALRHHNNAATVRRVVGKRIWDAYFTFCFERNPYDKAVSRYFWELRHRTDRWPSVSAFLESVDRYKLTNWGIYTINDMVAVDHVARYERLQEELQQVSHRIGLPEVPELPRAKGSYRNDRTHYSQFLDEHARRQIETICRREIDAFEYTFEPWESNL